MKFDAEEGKAEALAAVHAAVARAGGQRAFCRATPGISPTLLNFTLQFGQLGLPVLHAIGWRRVVRYERARPILPHQEGVLP